MGTRKFGPSYRQGLELVAAGCPIDDLKGLTGRLARERNLFYAEQLAGYAESRVYSFGPSDMGYLIGLRLRTDRPSGTEFQALVGQPSDLLGL